MSPVTAGYSFGNLQKRTFYSYFFPLHTHQESLQNKKQSACLTGNKITHWDIIYIQITRPWTGENKMGGGMSAKS